MLDAIRRDEPDVAFVHMPVLVRIEARAAGELEQRQISG